MKIARALLVATLTCLLASCGGAGASLTSSSGGSTGTLGISGTPGTSAVTGVSYSFAPTVTGAPSGATLTFSITGQPSWASFSTTTGALTGTPASSDTGNFGNIVISVSDGSGTAMLPAFTITVAAATDDSYVPTTTVCSGALVGTHNTYNVGPGQTYTDTTNVPWLSLQAGDVVNVYYQSTPYHTYIALMAQGTASNPVIINGVTSNDGNGNCSRPEISGTNAVYSADRSTVTYDNAYTRTDDVFEIWYGQGHYGQKPSHITIQNLKITNAASGSYAGGTGINAITADDLTVQNCEITNNNGWGIFTNTKNDSPAGQETSYRTVVRGNQIYNNGVNGSYLYHNLYIQGYRPVIEGNYIGALQSGAQGSSLKDRSSGTIIRYNTIVAAARAIDLVETEGGHGTVDADPLYRDAWVYGNIIINDDTTGQGSGDLIHWGYDNCFYWPCNPPGTFVEARTGTLHFYANTIVANMHGDRWAVFDQQSNGSSIDPHNIVELQNNILWNMGTAQMSMARDIGDVRFLATNWISSGWVAGDTGNTVSISGTANLIEGTDPMLDPTTYRPLAGSPVIGQASSNTPTAVLYEYDSTSSVVARATALDLGAREH
ncbi:MAG TPA: right-handed parallel beta-helix repeat-containing protein [Steroidobacteraceae bacterium]|nr:right-handed parallel beta-helix repeat-containing protein [Steroidobacteraceae bacterium]